MQVRKVAGAAVRAGLWVAASTALALPVAAANDGERPARISYYELLQVLPDSAGTAQRKAGDSTRQLRFDAFGRRFEISLGSNTRLMASKSRQSQLELYRGSIDGIAGSWVRLATKGGALHGMMWDGAQLYAIEPAAEVRDALDQAPADESQTIVFRLADVQMDPGAASCASESSPTKASDAYAALASELKNSTVAMQAAGATRRLELSALGDARFRARYGSEQDARDEILTRLNNVDGIFSTHLSIEIHVGTVSVPDAANDQLSATTTPNTLLRELANLRKRSPELSSHGLTHLFTDRDLDGTTIGIAYLDSLCDTQNAVGLTESRNVWLDSLVAAHEIGHNFGADHDGDSQGSCPNTPSSGFLMAPVVSGTDDFSSCSVTRMRSRTNGAHCLTNLPPANVRVAANLGAARRQLARPFRWELPISNSGGLDSRNVRAELTLPAQLSIADVGVVGGSCTSGGGAIECHLGDIPGGAVRTIELELSSEVAGSHAIVAHVTADHDANRGDNDGSGTIVVEAPGGRVGAAARADDGEGERAIHRRLRSHQCRRGQCGNGHGEDRHPGRHDGHQRIAERRHVYERRDERRVHAGAPRRRTDGERLRVAYGLRRWQRDTACQRLRQLLRHEQRERHCRPRRGRQRRRDARESVVHIGCKC